MTHADEPRTPSDPTGPPPATDKAGEADATGTAASKGHALASDLRGAARLATDATAALADLVEAVHHRILRVPGLADAPPAGEPPRTGGITGLVYRSVRGVTRLVGGSVDGLLGLLAQALGPAASASSPTTSGPEREAVVSALNGVLGDHLEETANPLALTMTLRFEGRALALDADSLAVLRARTTGRVLLLLHGLCMGPQQWQREGHDHGAALARDAGYTPVYLHYNSGRHVSANGADLAQRLAALLAHWPQPLDRVVLLGHSMGGLVARSALHQGRATGQAWVQRVDDLVCLGTPHHGAPLERVGHAVDLILGATPGLSSFTAPFARLGQLRSAGITDLRRGSLLAADWAGRDRFAADAPLPTALPLPAGLRCHALAGHLGEAETSLRQRLLGDGLVPLDSALGRHEDPARTLAFDPARQAVLPGVGHLGLLNDERAYAQLRRWLD